MPEHETTVRSRELGEGLRGVLERAGLTGKEVARQLDWSQSDVSRMLTGKRAVAATLLAGSLQTGDYARAVLTRIVNVPSEEIDERVAARLARSSIFSRPRPARYTFFIHEFVLRLPVGDGSVMSEQLHHLLRMSVRPYISLCVVPTSMGAHAGVEGSFTLMDFATIKPVIYLESATSTLFLEEPEEIIAYQRIVAALAETSLDEQQSRGLIRKIAVELYGDREDPDEHA